MDKYSSYSELAACEKEGEDSKLVVSPQEGLSIVIIAPHAGGIERGTGEIAQDIAGKDFSLYCFCGLKKKGNYRYLHITSHNFDEPKCVRLVANHRWVVAIHGCKRRGERVFLGGLDRKLINDLVVALRSVGILTKTSGHKYTGRSANNICNLGITEAGVQFELSLPFRNGPQMPDFVAAVREVLLQRQNEA